MMIFRKKSSLVMKPSSIFVDSLINRIVVFRLMKIQGRLLKSLCIHERSLFGVHFLLTESLGRISLKMKPGILLR